MSTKPAKKAKMHHAGTRSLAERALMPPRKQELRIWNAVRQTRRFTLADIAAIAEKTISQVRYYLQKWGALGVVRRDNDGWRLALDLGPLPPWRSIDRQTGKLLTRSTRPIVSVRRKQERSRQQSRVRYATIRAAKRRDGDA